MNVSVASGHQGRVAGGRVTRAREPPTRQHPRRSAVWAWTPGRLQSRRGGIETQVMGEEQLRRRVPILQPPAPVTSWGCGTHRGIIF